MDAQGKHAFIDTPHGAHSHGDPGCIDAPKRRVSVL